MILYVLLWSIIWIILMIIYVNIIKKITKNRTDLTELVRNIAIDNSKKRQIIWKEVFVIPAYNEWQVIKNTINQILNKWYKNIIVVTYSPR